MSLDSWLKGVNSGAIMLSATVTGNFATVDMGRDGKSGNSGDWARNKNVARDVVGFTLNYYDNDFRRIGNIGGDNTNFEMKYAGSLFAAASLSLYNGNIRHSVYSVGKLNLGTGGIIKPEGYAYKYDQLNRLVRMRATGTNSYSVSSSAQSWSTTNGMVALFQETAAYDPNGNITNYVRYGNQGGSNTKMDSLVYHNVASDNNRLAYIDDLQTVAGRYSSDLDDQASANYDYDATGNLTQDVKEGISSGGITWSNAQKLASVTKSGQLLNFRYDAMQNRLWKANRNTGNNKETRTYYIRDAQGNVLATYTAWLHNAHLSTPDWDSIQLNERHIYGSSRLGIFQQNLRLWPSPASNDVNRPTTSGKGYVYEGLKRYELTNHLSNVLVVITDRKRGLATSGTTIQWYEADILASQNYYPFGMLMPGRTFSNPNVNSGYDYRYGFNRKEGDDEVKGDDNQQDYGMRIYDPRVGRWCSTDYYSNLFSDKSPYNFVGNNPIRYIDMDGDSLIVPDQSAFNDILSLVIYPGNRNLVSYDIITGQVSLGFSLVAGSGSDVGIDLIQNLTSSTESYYYENGDIEKSKSRTVGPGSISNTFYGKGAVNARGNPNERPISNLSVTPRNISMGIGTAGDEPAIAGISGYVRVSKNATFYELMIDPKNPASSPIRKLVGGMPVVLNRASVIFHELTENYERTHNLQPYSRSNGTGAHQNAILQESNQYGNGYPGAAGHSF